MSSLQDGDAVIMKRTVGSFVKGERVVIVSVRTRTVMVTKMTSQGWREEEVPLDAVGLAV